MYTNLISETELISIIPVYSRTIEEWKTSYHKKLKVYLTERENLYTSEGVKFSENLKRSYEIRFNERSVPWRYNDVIGFIELRLIKENLQMYFYKWEKNKFKFEHSYEHTIENFTNKNLKNQKSDVLSGIEEIKTKYQKFKKKYFDIEMFLVALKYLNQV